MLRMRTPGNASLHHAGEKLSITVIHEILSRSFGAIEARLHRDCTIDRGLELACGR